jgi:hypothetical protein
MKKTITLTMLILTLLASGCGVANTAAPAPTQDVALTLDAVRTQAVETAEADMASQATETMAAATPTLAPTATEIPTATELPTLPPATLAPTFTSAPVVYATPVPADFDCSVSNTSPVYLAEFSPRGEMDGKWTVKNTGTKTWGSTDVDVMYVGGEKMYQYDSAYNLAKDVAPGESIDITVDMLAPAEAGTYRTTWGLVYGGSAFCTFNLTIKVK